MLDLRTLGIATLVSLTLGACASYEQQHVNYGSSQVYSNSVTANEITFAAEPYDTEAEVVGAFDENLLEKGYYPVKILIENKSDDRVIVFRESVELQDPSGYSYHPVTASEMADDFEDNKIAYALLGFGIFSYMSADDANKERSADYQAKELGESQIIPAGRSRGAFVYFKLPEGTNVSASLLTLDAENLDSKETTRLELPLGQMYSRSGSGTSVSTASTSPTEAKAPNTPTFDGVWILEVSNSRETDRIRTVVTNGRFSASFSTNGWRGKLTGEINEFGTLIGNGTASSMAWGSNNVPIGFTTQYRSGGFKEVVIAKGRVKPTFGISLVRDAAGS